MQRNIAPTLYVAFAMLSISSGRAGDDIDRLPPYIVEDTIVSQPWKHMSFERYEVISRVREDVSRSYLEHLLRQFALLRMWVPDVLLDIKPAEMMLVTPQQADAWDRRLSQEMNASVRRRTVRVSRISFGGSLNDLRPDPDPAIEEDLPQMDYMDGGLDEMIYGIDERLVSYKARRVANDYFMALLENRTPALPGWFKNPIADIFFETMTDKGNWSGEGPIRADPLSGSYAQPPLSIQELFAQLVGPPTNAWAYQAKLFIYWAYDGPYARREALWRFVQLAAEQDRQSVSEATFQKCFGIYYGPLQAALTAYMPLARQHGPVLVGDTDAVPVPDLHIRDATNAEVARIEANLMRLETTSLVARKFPQFLRNYSMRIEALLAGVKNSQKDPQLDAAKGVYLAQFHREREAEPFLTCAVANGVNRPDVCGLLAHVRLLDLTGGTARPLSEAEVHSVLEPIRSCPSALKLLPVVHDVYFALANAKTVSASDAALLSEGLKYYPSLDGLTKSVAAINMKAHK